MGKLNTEYMDVKIRIISSHNNVSGYFTIGETHYSKHINAKTHPGLTEINQSHVDELIATAQKTIREVKKKRFSMGALLGK